MWHTETFRSFGAKGLSLQKERYDNYMRNLQQQKLAPSKPNTQPKPSSQKFPSSTRDTDKSEVYQQFNGASGTSMKPASIAQVPATSPPSTYVREPAFPPATLSPEVARAPAIPTTTILSPTVGVAVESKLKFSPDAPPFTLPTAEVPEPTQVAAIPKRPPPGTGKYARAPIPTVPPKVQQRKMKNLAELLPNPVPGPGYTAETSLTSFLGRPAPSTLIPSASPWEPIRPDHPAQKTLEEVEDELEALQLQKDIDRFRYDDDEDVVEDPHWSSPEAPIPPSDWENPSISPLSVYSATTPMPPTVNPAFTAPLYTTDPHATGASLSSPQWQPPLPPAFAPPYATTPYRAPWIQASDMSVGYGPHAASYVYPAPMPAWEGQAGASFGAAYHAPQPPANSFDAQLENVRHLPHSSHPLTLSLRPTSRTTSTASVSS